MRPVTLMLFFFFFNDTATPEIYTLSLHDALPIWQRRHQTASALQPDHARHVVRELGRRLVAVGRAAGEGGVRSEEHTSELQSRLHLVCRLLLEKKKTKYTPHTSASATHRHASNTR